MASDARKFAAACLSFAVALAVLLLFPAIEEGPLVPLRRSTCNGNLRRILLALQQYDQDHNSYPPPYVADANGVPMHSWRVLLLPYLDQQKLYDKYRFDEPWDGPNNHKLHDVALPIFQCPSHGAKDAASNTSYAAVVGSKTAWLTGGKRPISAADITRGDGCMGTILVVEVADSGIHWMEPRDLQFDQMPMAINPPSGLGISSHHPGGALVGLADGRTKFVNNSVPPETLRAALTRNGKDNNQLHDW